MRNIQKFIILSIIIFLSFAFVSCNSEITTTTIDETTEVETTTALITVVTTESTTASSEETTTVYTTTYVDYSRLEIVAPTKLEYHVSESLDLTGLVVTYYDADNNPRVLRTGVYTVSEVDMSTVGQKLVTIYFLTYEASFIIEVIMSSSYYETAMNLTGNALFLELRSIIQTGFSGVTYGDARYILDETDIDPTNSSNLILVYLGTSVSSEWDEGITWNREHVWPQSGMPVSADNNVVNMASDLQNLKPSNPAENSFRGNKWFDYVPTTSVSAYEPRDEVKGDIARILLYMIVMYDELSLVDVNPNIYAYEMGIFSTLLEWNNLDPVDEFEMNRNDVIYSYQNNRNPFIDYPEFADLIWQ